MVERKAKKTRASVEEYGLVIVVSGPHEGRIGYYDDDEGRSGIVYFGGMFFGTGYCVIPLSYLSPVTTQDLMRRLNELFEQIGLKARASGTMPSATRHIDLLTELALVQDALAERMFNARFTSDHQGQRVFISHASEDKPFARSLAIDLADAGHRPWLDEWQIRAGESIPTRISEGVSECDYVVVLLSEHSVTSQWVEREWQAKYWAEAESRRIQVIPVLLGRCDIPALLKPKKYANFTKDYRSGFEELLLAIKA